jgi:hypothetical protein
MEVYSGKRRDEVLSRNERRAAANASRNSKGTSSMKFLHAAVSESML